MREYDFTLGGRGRLGGGVGYDVHLRYHHRHATEDGATFVSDSRIQTAIEDGRYNLENPLSGNTSEYPDHLAAIRETGLRLTHDEITDYKAARASLDGAAFTLGGGDARWAAGAEVAFETWKDLFDYRDVHGAPPDNARDVLGSAGNSASGRRRRWAAFTEVSLPMRDNWDVVLNGRRDDHDDVGATVSYQVASRYRLHETLAVRVSWSEGGKAPSLEALHLSEALGYPSICDTKTHTGDPADCDEYQVERLYQGNPGLRPDKAESVSMGAVTGLGPFSLSADWFRIRLFEVPSRLSAQSIIDLEVAGRKPPGVEVIRDPDTDVILRIVGPPANSGEDYATGFDVRARAGWETAWADLGIDVRWLQLNRHEHRVAGEVQPGDYPRHRVHASLRASKGGVTAQWSVQAVSGYWNTLRTGRYKAWVGHDITLRWRGAFGFSGLDLTGGVLNVGDRGPSTDPTNPGSEGADVTLDSIRGRTLFLGAKVSF